MLSVIIPTRLTDARCSRTLLTLSKQDIDPTLVQIVVIGDGISPDSLESIRSMRMPYQMKVIAQPHRGVAAARNRGAAEASGDHLLFVDDDMDLSIDFLRQVVRRLAEGADVVLSDIRIGDWVRDTLPVRVARRQEQDARQARRLGRQLVFEDMVFAATAIRRAVFERAGGFDPSFSAGDAYGNEDIELGYRLLRNGVDIRRALEAVAYSDRPHELSILLARARKVGANDVRLARKHPELAAALFGRKLLYSRTHRLVGTTVLSVPAIVRGEGLLRWPVRRFVHDQGREGPVRTRLWLALRSFRYWRGVSDAGGRRLAFTGQAMERRDPSSQPASDPPGAHSRGR